MKKPDQQVSEQVIAAFQKEKLLQHDDSLKGVAEKLAAGKMTSNEWKMLFKLDAAEKKSKDDGKNQT